MLCPPNVLFLFLNGLHNSFSVAAGPWTLVLIRPAIQDTRYLFAASPSQTGLELELEAAQPSIGLVKAISCRATWL